MKALHSIWPPRLESHCCRKTFLKKVSMFFFWKQHIFHVALQIHFFVLFNFFLIARFMTWWGPWPPTSRVPAATPISTHPQPQSATSFCDEAAEYVAHKNGLTISEVHSVTLVKRVGWSSCFPMFHTRRCEKQTRILAAHANQNCTPCSRRYWIILIAMWLNCWRRRWMVETCRHKCNMDIDIFDIEWRNLSLSFTSSSKTGRWRLASSGTAIPLLKTNVSPTVVGKIYIQYTPPKTNMSPKKGLFQ